ncbi:hypothetical protein V1522DRAFT_145679 [Lipomyces starkeyi]
MFELFHYANFVQVVRMRTLHYLKVSNGGMQLRCRQLITLVRIICFRLLTILYMICYLPVHCDNFVCHRLIFQISVCSAHLFGLYGNLFANKYCISSYQSYWLTTFFSCIACLSKTYII